MSINNIEQNVNGSNNFYSSEKADVSFFEQRTPQETINASKTGTIPGKFEYALRPDYFIPLEGCRSQIMQTYSFLNQTKLTLEKLLLNIYINPSINISLEESHRKLWKELLKYNSTQKNAPDHISFNEYKYAERSMSTSARRMIENYHQSISQSSFAYLFDLRNLLIFMLNEASNIKDILLLKFGDDYEDDSQKQIALQFDSWAKMASQHTQYIRQTIISSPGEIPASELDKTTKKQAVEFQAFFSIKLNALHDETKNILESLKRDYVDNCDIFYERYLSQSIDFKNQIVSSMELDYYTTALSRELPVMTQELLSATNIINSNFGMILADMIQRSNVINFNVEKLFSLVISKRRYSNYIYQLSSKGQPKPVIIKTVKSDEYAKIFDLTHQTYRTESDLVSSHSSLDDLTENHHPQYLLKNGGIIDGDIFVKNNAKIDGVNLSTHTHTGSDGSERIRSTDIDYQSVRETEQSIPSSPTSVNIVEYITDILDGGVPAADAIIDIEIDDNLYNENYDYVIEVIQI
jgi:hypothetical protein